MTDAQWSALFRGDESYGRNTGYYCLLDAFRDTFERGDQPVRLVDKLLSPTNDDYAVAALSLHLADAEEGGFFNSGKYQLERPNTFITPQGRCAEHLLFSTVAEIMRMRADVTGPIYVPSNGFFDTTEAHAHVNRLRPVNLMDKHLLDDFPVAEIWHKNPFKGNIDTGALEAFIERVGPSHVALILLTVTNNTCAGQPVSMQNIRDTKAIADRYSLPLFADACRFAENARFIQEFEEGYANMSIPAIVKEMFSHVDGFTISLKKDGLANIGGMLCIRDQGVFHGQYSTWAGRDVGVMLKEKQILLYGNDSYGGMSGRDIVACCVGLYEVIKTSYLRRRVNQTRMFAEDLTNAGIPVILPPGGHAVYLDMGRFFSGLDGRMDDFRGVGFCIELLRLYGIRACELGPFAFEWDQKDPEEQQTVLNLVRFAVPRNAFNSEHISYTVAAVKELYRMRALIPTVKIVRGRELHLRHFQAALQPIYPYTRPGHRPSLSAPSDQAHKTEKKHTANGVNA
eukprot:comp20644_c0_seq1/m.26733 comp20644_c0_seq1/g.26733  ORF comp20644_c0_seq1/g.26733 comp20644_c0_seq1/m.26733 type:complete len:512 (-) comp20644_c0_seq1:376-1911(-)